MIRRRVPLHSLSYWPGNYRLGGRALSQQEAFNAMVTSQGKKLVKLIGGIGQYGFREVDELLLMPTEDGYEVRDGNRRLTAVRLIVNPSTIDGVSSLPTATKAAIKAAATRAAGRKGELADLPCAVFSEAERDLLESIIDDRHQGLNDGSGVDGWGAVEKTRRNADRGRKDPNTDSLRYLDKALDYKIITRDQPLKTFTTFARILKREAMQRYLGEESWDDGQFRARAFELVRKVWGDAHTKPLNVNTVKTDDDINQWINDNFDIGDSDPSVCPSESPLPNGKRLPEANDSPDPGKGEPHPRPSSSTDPLKDKKKDKPPRAVPPPHPLQTLDVVWPNTRLHALAFEGKTKVQENAHNILAILLRVMLDLLFQEYEEVFLQRATAKNGTTRDRSHSERANDVLAHMMINSPPLLSAKQKQNVIDQYKALHVAVHDRDIHPYGGDSRTWWLQCEPFIQAVCKELSKGGQTHGPSSKIHP